MQKLATEGADRRSWFDTVVKLVLADDASTADHLRAQVAFDTVSAALFATQGTNASEDDVQDAAHAATIRLT